MVDTLQAEEDTPAPRESIHLPQELSLGDLTRYLRRIADVLPDVPDLVLLKKVHIHLRGSSLDDAESFLQLTVTAKSVTAYGCTADSLDVHASVLQEHNCRRCELLDTFTNHRTVSQNPDPYRFQPRFYSRLISFEDTRELSSFLARVGDFRTNSKPQAWNS